MKKYLVMLFCLISLIISTSVLAAGDVGKVISLNENDNHITFYLESNLTGAYRQCYVGDIDYEGKEIADKVGFALRNSLTYDLVILYDYESSGGTVYPLSVDIVYSDKKVEVLEEKIEELEQRTDNLSSIPPAIRKNR